MFNLIRRIINKFYYALSKCKVTVGQILYHAVVVDAVSNEYIFHVVHNVAELL